MYVLCVVKHLNILRVRSSMAKPIYVNTMGYGVQVYYEQPIPDDPPKYQHRCGDWYFYLGKDPIIPEAYGRFAKVLPDGTLDKYFIQSIDYRYFPKFKEVL